MLTQSAEAEQCAHKASFTLKASQAPSWPYARSMTQPARNAKRHDVKMQKNNVKNTGGVKFQQALVLQSHIPAKGVCGQVV